MECKLDLDNLAYFKKDRELSVNTKKVVLTVSVAEALKLNNKNDRQYQLFKVDLHVRTKTV